MGKLRTRPRAMIGAAAICGLLVLIALALVPHSAEAATATIVPNADRSGSSGTWTVPGPGVGTVACAVATRYGCVDESSGSGYDDTDYLRLTAAAFGGTHLQNWELENVPGAAATSNVVATLRTMFSGSVGGCNLNAFRIMSSTGATLANSGAQTIGTSTPTAVVVSLPSAGLSRSELDGLWVQIDHDRCTSAETRVYSVEADITYSTTNLSGQVADTSICDSFTPVVRIAVNATVATTVPCAPVTGLYATSVDWSAGDIVTAFYDGVGPKASFHTRTAASSGTPITMDLASGEARVQSLSAAPLTAADINQYDGSNDADIQVNYPGSGAIVASSGTTLAVVAGPFATGQSVTTPAMWVHAGATYAPGTATLRLTGSGTGTCSDSVAQVPFCAPGTFTPGTSTVSYEGASTTDVSGATYATLALASSNVTFNLGASGATTITASSLTITGTGTVADTSAYSPTLTVSGVVTVNTGATLGGSGTGTTTITGNFTGGGSVNFTGGTVDLRSAGAAQQLNPTTNPWQFSTLRVSTSSGSRVVTVPAAAREIRASQSLQVGNALDTNTTTLASSAMTQPMVTRYLTVTNRGTFQAPPSLTITGSLASGGTFTAGTGTVTMSGTDTAQIQISGGTNNFYRISITTPGKAITLNGNLTVTNQLTLNGGSCATPVSLRSSVVGTQRTITTTGATMNFDFLRVQDVRTSTASSATNSVDLGNTANIAFSGTGCGPLLPNADLATGGTFTTTGSAPCAGAAKWECVNERVFSPTDTDYVSSPAGVANIPFDMTTMTVSSVVTGLTINVRARTTTAPCTMTLRATLQGGAVLATSSVALTTALANYSATSGSLYLDQTDLDGVRTELLFAANCAAASIVTAVHVDVEQSPGTIFGHVDNLGICDGTNPVVGVAVNSTKFDTVPCDAGTGAFYAAPTFAATDTIAVYYDDVPGGAATAGATWVKAATSSSTAITAVTLSRQRYRTEARSAGVAITGNDINKWSEANDADIRLKYDFGTIVTDPAAIFEVGRNTFAASLGLQSSTIWTRSGATLDSTSANIYVTGSGTGACDDTTANRPFCVAGSFVQPTTYTFFSGSAATTVPGGTYGRIRFIGAGPFRLGSPENTTINTTFLEATSGTAETTTYSPTINVSGDMQWYGATLTGSGSGTITVGGNVIGTGSVNLTGGTFELRNSGAAQNLNPTSNPWQFATLGVSTSAGPRTVTIPSTSRPIYVSTLLRVGMASDSSTTTLSATNMTQPIAITGNFETTTRGTFEAPPSTSIAGNVLNSGTFVPNSGAVSFVGAGTSNITSTGSGTLYDMNVVTGGKVVELGSSVAVTHGLALAGSSCASPVTLRSSASGVQRTVANAGATVTTTYASFRDISMSAPVSVTSAGNVSGNAGITFGDNAVCGAPSLLYADTTNASAGALNATNVNGAAAFHMSFRNNTGASADRYKTEVSTSPLDSSVLGLWPLDGTGADRAATGSPATMDGGVGFTSGDANFGQALSLDGVDDGLIIPVPPSYDVSTYTVELWMKASSLGSASWPLLASRSTGTTDTQFSIYAQASDGNLIAAVSANGTFYGTNTPMAPWLDNTWHHIAMTADASKDIRLYVDGNQYGPTIRYTGTLDMPTTPIRVGGTYANNRFLGAIDDLQISNRAKTRAELAGYAATKRPHAQTVWYSTNHNGNGDALSSSCATAARCNDIIYGGPSIHRDGARYYVTQQTRTAADLWSLRTTDWFETSDSIAVVTPGTATLPSATPGTDQTTALSVTTTCTSAAGCTLNLVGTSDTVGLATVDSSISIPRINPASPTAPSSWASGSAIGLGFTVLTSTSGKDTGRWGTGTNFTNLALLNFIGATRTPTLLTTMGNTTETTVVGARLNAPTSTPPGTYAGTVQLVAVAAP